VIDFGEVVFFGDGGEGLGDVWHYSGPVLLVLFFLDCMQSFLGEFEGGFEVNDEGFANGLGGYIQFSAVSIKSSP